MSTGHKFTLDAFQAEGARDLVWEAVRMGAPWNGWATPVVDRATLTSLLSVLATRTSEPHRWDGDVAVVSGPLDLDDRPTSEDRLSPGADGLYDLGLLGWTWVLDPV